MSNELTATILVMDEEGALTIVKDRLDQGVAPERSSTTPARR
jgi:hypothetical protein